MDCRKLGNGDANKCKIVNHDELVQKGLSNIKGNVVDKCSWDSFHYKDLKGLIMLLILVSAIVCAIMYFYNNDSLFIKIAGGLLLILAFTIYDETVSVLYMPSSLITLQTLTPAYLDKDKYFPKYKTFENPTNWKKMRDELDLVLNSGKKLPSVADTFDNDFIGNTVQNHNNEIQKDTNNWKMIPIKLAGEINQEGAKMFPFTTQLVNDPDIITCFYSVLGPKSHIPLHTGYYKGVLRYQLGMKIPKDRKNVYICVNQHTYNWTDGEGVLFDDTYPHQVFNHTNETRVILYLDVMRPLKGILGAMNRGIFSAAASLGITSAENKKLEKQLSLS